MTNLFHHFPDMMNFLMIVSENCDFIVQASYVDINTWLVDTVLAKLDRIQV